MKERRVLDWDEARARLASSREAIERALHPDEQRIAAVFRRRATRLAGPAETGPAVSGTAVLVFRLGAGRWGVELPALAEVIAAPLLAPVPGAPAQLAGVLQVRGEIRPVWELTRLLAQPDLDAGGGEFVLLLRKDGREFGLRVGAVEGIRTFAPEERGTPQGRPAHVKWMAQDLIPVLDVGALDPRGLPQEETR